MAISFFNRFSTKLIFLIGVVFLIPVVTSLSMLALNSRASMARFNQYLAQPAEAQRQLLKNIFPQRASGEILHPENAIAFIRDYERRRNIGQFSSLIVVSFALAGVVILLSMLVLKRGMLSLRELSIAAAKVGEGDLNVTPVARSSDEFAQLIGVFCTMTARLRETMVSRDFINQVVESMPAAVFTVDNNGRIITWNRQAEKLTGIAAADVLGRTSSSIEAVIGKMPVKSEIPFFGREAVIRPRGGGQRIVSRGVDFLQERNSVGEAGIIATFVDISEIKELERQLTIAKEKAEEASRLKSEFLANMSHEIRTPLNGIMGLAEVLEEGESDEGRRASLAAVKQCGRNLLHIINEILDISKLEAGRMALHTTIVVIADIIREARHTVEVGCRKKGIELTTEIAEGVPAAIEGDGGKIVQILVNLLGNSLKFTERGSIRVCVAAYRGERRGDIVFSVIDTGIGIPDDKKEHVFESFVQAEGHLTKASEGTGLGLAIARKLIGLMGGEIWMESEAGKGSTFSFTIESVAPNDPSAVRDN